MDLHDDMKNKKENFYIWIFLLIIIVRDFNINLFLVIELVFFITNLFTNFK